MKKKAKEVTKERKTVPIGKAARELELSPSTVLRAAAKGIFPSFRTPGGHYRVDLEAARKALRKNG